MTRCHNPVIVLEVEVTEQISQGECRHYTTRPCQPPPPQKVVVVPPAPPVITNNNYNYNYSVSYNCSPQNWGSYSLNASNGAMVVQGSGLSFSFVPRTNISVCVSSVNNNTNVNNNSNANSLASNTVVNTRAGTATGTAGSTAKSGAGK